MADRIEVCSAAGEYSNFAPLPLTRAKKKWPTSQHYFQAMKFEDSKLREKIRRSKNSAVSAKLGRARKTPIRRSWHGMRFNVMRDAVRAKFTPHEELTELLLKTGAANLVGHIEADSFWSDGGDGSGRNVLGRLLMEVRSELRRDRFQTSSSHLGEGPRLLTRC
ncbi:MAG: ribA/ribD-fused uncharacterized protein [Bradymonadia bacterium]|jgi:ribA/ribD-fused uncharacterized protein